MAKKQHFSFQSESPSASELNMLGEYLLVCLAFVVLALLEFALIIVLNRRDAATIKTTKMEPSLSTEKPNLEPVTHKLTKLSFLGEDSKGNRLTKEDQACTNTIKKDMQCISMIVPIHAIDLTASFVFPMAFAMYNFAYWIRTFDGSKAHI